MSNILSSCLDLRYLKPDPEPGLLTITRPEPDPKSKSAIRQALLKSNCLNLCDHNCFHKPWLWKHSGDSELTVWWGRKRSWGNWQCHCGGSTITKDITIPFYFHTIAIILAEFTGYCQHVINSPWNIQRLLSFYGIPQNASKIFISFSFLIFLNFEAIIYHWVFRVVSRS